MNFDKIFANILDNISIIIKYSFAHNDSSHRDMIINYIKSELDSINNLYMLFNNTDNPLFIYKIVCDETNNTCDIIDSNKIKIRIWHGHNTITDYTDLILG